ncbi:hypothetical protein RF11_05786 [Thelohanellus kitauei]|uniref:Uncharacterized protein n=1 Tax=Thelohanellus kitauei TaxID=669202 RepID=A0A0C2M9S4_THEKT|nr:hypothetical protein RF11_05786 [Thelohanellus kitauei]
MYSETNGGSYVLIQQATAPQIYYVVQHYYQVMVPMPHNHVSLYSYPSNVGYFQMDGVHTSEYLQQRPVSETLVLNLPYSPCFKPAQNQEFVYHPATQNPTILHHQRDQDNIHQNVEEDTFDDDNISEDIEEMIQEIMMNRRKAEVGPSPDEERQINNEGTVHVCQCERCQSITWF